MMKLPAAGWIAPLKLERIEPPLDKPVDPRKAFETGDHSYPASADRSDRNAAAQAESARAVDGECPVRLDSHSPVAAAPYLPVKGERVLVSDHATPAGQLICPVERTFLFQLANGLFACEALGGFYEWQFCRPLPAPAADMGGWVEWRGGECPLSAHAKAHCKFRDGTSSKGELPVYQFDWEHRPEHADSDIVAYKILA